MDTVIFVAIEKLNHLGIFYKFPNVWASLSSLVTPRATSPTESTLTPTPTPPTKYWGAVIAGLPPLIMTGNTIFVLARQVLSKEADRDKDLTLIAMAIETSVTLIGTCAAALELAFGLGLTDMQNVIFRLAELQFKRQAQNTLSQTVEEQRRMDAKKRKLAKTFQKICDAYLINATITWGLVVLTPFFFHKDASYFLMKHFFQNNPKSFWVSCIRAAWTAMAAHRWMLTASHGILYIISVYYWLATTLRTTFKNGVDLVLTESEQDFSEAVSTYKQIYVLVQRHNLNTRWAMGITWQGLWFQLILTCTTSIHYGSRMLFTEPQTYLVFPLLLGFALIFSFGTLALAGAVHKLCTQFVQSPLGHIPRRKYYIRLKKGVRITGIQFGDCFFIDGNYFWAFWLSALDQTIGLLMSI